MEPSSPPKTRPPQACGTCHEKKIRCDLADGGPPCSNCRVYDTPCQPHQRKRKRPPRQFSPNTDSYARDKRCSRQSPNARRFSAPERDTQSLLALDPNHHVLQLSAVESLSVQRQGATPPVTEETEDVAGNTPESRGYLGRSEYIGGTISQANEGTTDAQPEQAHLLSHEERVTLEVHKAFDLPSPSVQRSLIESFQKHCAPWMPIVEEDWLHASGDTQPSLLLLQSVFLAGSRVAAAPHISATAGQYYRRAKALFFSSYEKNPIIKIAAACLLNWWNPRGPEEVSLDGSSFWLRVAVSVAYQIGLHREPPGGKIAKYRRRLWWTLVARDCQLSAAHGRPRAISLADSNVAPPSILDFCRDDPNAELFVAFVKIDTILADVTKSYLRHQLSNAKRQEVRNSLYCWVNELPDSLRLNHNGHLSPYNFYTRSLYIGYFVTVAILYRSSSTNDMSASVSVVAAAFMGGICEEMLVRDDLRFLGPIFKFYVFAAAMAMLNARSHLLESELNSVLDILKASLVALTERWPSAARNLEVIDGIMQSPVAHAQSRLPRITQLHDGNALFNSFGPELCAMWYLVELTSESSGPKHLMDNRVSCPNHGGLTLSPAQAPSAHLNHMETLASASFRDHINSDGAMDPSTLWTWPSMQVGDWLIDPDQLGLFGG